MTTDDAMTELDEPHQPLSREQRDSVLDALNTIEAAQKQIHIAAELLCSVPGFGDGWDAARALDFAVKDRWNAVEATFRLIESSSHSAPDCELIISCTYFWRQWPKACPALGVWCLQGDDFQR